MKRYQLILRSNITPALLLAFLFFILFTYYSVYKHLTFQTSAFDLGIYSQATYLYSQYLSPFSTLKHMIILGDHFGPILALVSPIYNLFPNSVTLLVLQAGFVALSSIPIFLIAQDKLKNKFLSLLITLAYLTSPGILAAINFDFHLATISTLPLSLILYAWYFKKWRLYWLMLIFSLFFKEDIPLFIFGLGIYQICQKKLMGFATTAFAMLSFYLIEFQLMPYFAPLNKGSYLSTSMLPLTDPSALVFLLFTHPTVYSDLLFNSQAKINTIDLLYRQFAFFSVLSPLSWLTAFPSLYLRFTSTQPHLWGNMFHHNANLTPFLAVSAIFSITKFNIPKNVVFGLLIFFLIFGSLSPRSFIWKIPQLNIQNRFNYEYINKSLQTISPNSAISAQSPLVPHLSNREKIYLYPEVLDAEYIILDTSLDAYPLEAEKYLASINDLKKSPSWEIIQTNKNLIIFKKK